MLVVHVHVKIDISFISAGISPRVRGRNAAVIRVIPFVWTALITRISSDWNLNDWRLFGGCSQRGSLLEGFSLDRARSTWPLHRQFTCASARARAHTHTHTHIYIYIIQQQHTHTRAHEHAYTLTYTLKRLIHALTSIHNIERTIYIRQLTVYCPKF